MSNEEKALVPVDQRTVNFYGDELTAVLVEIDGQQRIYIPIKPICEFLGIGWDAQRQRINRDPVLSGISMSASIMLADIEPSSRRPRTSIMICLPLDYLNGWLFGVNSGRAKEEVRERLIRYQKECYRILADAFLNRPGASTSPAVHPLETIREMGRTIMLMAEQQLEADRRLATTEERLDKAAVFVGSLGKRLTAVERRVKAGPLTEEQAQEIKKRVNQVALLLTEQRPDEKHFPGVYAALQEEAGVTSYKNIPPAAFEAAVEWLDNWIMTLQRGRAEEMPHE